MILKGGRKVLTGYFAQVRGLNSLVHTALLPYHSEDSSREQVRPHQVCNLVHVC